ncbi:hypothetical protein GPECTOR_20g393 [Gonium pectorale]|uniref:Uncharacterized protein n=1 Tax=Gonium pectorale TaxID=33097 RepID=A0A150GIC0_GONPE|nr:hypothetical protein GPECTOR_20g393 [Gonium pectorale]|eukprot:KXZ49539.1 hypothetical protein GPECTOR_20g393 [Gonium pectorale]
MEALPDRAGTLQDLAPILAADPDIAPKLDYRYPEFVDVGLRQGALKLYRYDEQVMMALGQGRKRGK